MEDGESEQLLVVKANTRLRYGSTSSVTSVASPKLECESPGSTNSRARGGSQRQEGTNCNISNQDDDLKDLISYVHEDVSDEVSHAGHVTNTSDDVANESSEEDTILALQSTANKTGKSDGDVDWSDENLCLPLQIEDTTRDVMNLSFAGCGFLGVYHLGACAALIRHGAELLRRVEYYGGASAGALVAAALVVRGHDPNTIQECNKFVHNIAADVGRRRLGVLTPGVSLIAPVERFLRELMPDDAYRLASGRLFISLTSVQGKKNKLVSDFDSNEHLVQCLMASSYIPFITGSRQVSIGGMNYMDGGMSDNLPLLQTGRTIRVSPFAGGQEICPRDNDSRPWFTRINGQDFKVNSNNAQRGLHCLFPPKPKGLQRYYRNGYDDAVRFLQEEGLYQQKNTSSNC